MTRERRVTSSVKVSGACSGMVSTTGSNRSCGVMILMSKKRFPQTSCCKVYTPRNQIWEAGELYAWPLDTLTF